MRRSRKPLCGYPPYRGFESLPLRHDDMTTPASGDGGGPSAFHVQPRCGSLMGECGGMVGQTPHTCGSCSDHGPGLRARAHLLKSDAVVTLRVLRPENQMLDSTAATDAVPRIAPASRMGTSSAMSRRGWPKLTARRDFRPSAVSQSCGVLQAPRQRPEHVETERDRRVGEPPCPRGAHGSENSAYRGYCDHACAERVCPDDDARTPEQPPKHYGQDNERNGETDDVGPSAHDASPTRDMRPKAPARPRT